MNNKDDAAGSTKGTAEAVRLAPLTGAGRGAVAVWQARSSRFAEVPVGRCRLLELGDEGVTEDVVVARLSEAVVEVATHGGDAVAERTRKLLQADAFPAPRGFNAECLDALSQAVTRRTAAWLLRMADGRLRAALERAASAPESEQQTLLSPLVTHAEFGRRLTEPARVVVFGKPNAGKSSLLNRLAGLDRALVDPRPGATRDATETVAVIDGWPVLLIDTAGDRETSDAVEAAGVDRGRHAVASADIPIHVVDRTDEGVEGMSPDFPGIVVAHKSDLTETIDRSWPAGTLNVSSRTGEGVAELRHQITERLNHLEPAEGAVFPVTPRQRALIETLAGDADCGRPRDALWAELLR